jgi:threonyl-tRNA synthetase
MKISLSQPPAILNQTAAILMAAAVTELFPGTLLVGGEGTPQRFFYDFFFPFEFQADFLPLIEERMRLIIREKRKVKALEMMPSNAAALMRHRSQELVAATLEETERALVEMCQIGEFVAYSPLPTLTELAIPFVKLFEWFTVGKPQEKIIRIVGAAASEKDLLKKIAKQESSSSRSHEILAKQLGMFEPLEEGLWLWKQKGEALREQLVELWKKEHRKQNFELIASPAFLLGNGQEGSLTDAHLGYFLRGGSKKTAEIALVSNKDYSDPLHGLFSPKAHFIDLAHLFFPDEKLLEECISSLQFICQIPKILGFEFEVILSLSGKGVQKTRPRAAQIFSEALEKTGIAYTVQNQWRPGTLASIDICIADALGRRWSGPSLRIPEAPMPVGKGSMLVRSAFGSLERIVALLLEQKGGWLPFFIAPEQIRILVAPGKGLPYARQVRERLQREGFRVSIEGRGNTLKSQVYQAAADKVPYLVLLGEREEQAKTLTVRAYGENKEQALSLDEFCTRLKSEMGSYTSELTN